MHFQIWGTVAFTLERCLSVTVFANAVRPMENFGDYICVTTIGTRDHLYALRQFGRVR
jgi:hypothetical protein